MLTRWVTLGILAVMVSTHAMALPADDEAAVAKLDTEYQEAVKKNDAATMDRILADDFVLVLGSGKTFSKADLLEQARSGKTVYEHQEDSQQKVRVWETPRSSQRFCGSRGPRKGSPSSASSGSVTFTCGLQKAGGMSSARLRFPCRRRLDGQRNKNDPSPYMWEARREQTIAGKETIMKKKDVRKLTLSRETIIRLENTDLHKALGGAWSDDSVCPTVNPSNRICP